MANHTKEDRKEGLPPALFEHCVNTYNAMMEEAHAVTTDDLNGKIDEVIVYEGFLTQLITGKLNLSVPYYTSIRKALIEMGCIRQLRRGGSTTQSQWELIYEPTLEMFLKKQPVKQRSAAPTASQVRDQRLDELEKQVRGLLEFKEGVLEYLAQKQGVEESI